MKNYNISQISRLLAGRAEEVCRWLLPNGKRIGNEWCVGDISGVEGKSLRVNLASKSGVWSDFAGGEGGDLIDLIMVVKQLSKSDAVSMAKDFLGVVNEAQEFVPSKKKYQRPVQPENCGLPHDQGLAFFASRQISPETVKLFSIGQVNNAIVFPYLLDGSLVFYKCRALYEKKFWASANSEPILFGWQAVPMDARYIVIVEGEIDAMSLRQQGIWAVSVPFGGGTKNKQDQWISCEWDRLELFDMIYLALDNDSEGIAATEHIAQRIGRHRCKKVTFGPHKDANEALMAGENLQVYIASAQDCAPAELRPASDFIEEVIAYNAGDGASFGYLLPWGKTHNKIQFRKSEISLWAGVNGHGKSCIIGHLLADSINQSERWCVASMEFKPFKFLQRLFRQTSGESLPSAHMCRNELAQFYDSNLYIFDVQGTARAERILEVFEYAFRRYGCTSFLVDSLAKCGFGEDDYNSQKAFVDKLMEFSQKFDVHVHFVCHARKGKTEEDVPGKFDVKGTGALTDMVDNVFVVWRNKKKEMEKANCKSTAEATKINNAPDGMIDCHKQRNGSGWEGRILLWFDPASLQYKENSTYQPYTYLPGRENCQSTGVVHVETNQGELMYQEETGEVLSMSEMSPLAGIQQESFVDDPDEEGISESLLKFD